MYSSKHFARTYYLAFKLPHQSRYFVVMGAGASKAKFYVMREVGLHDLDEINRHLGAGYNIDAGELSYYLCTVKVEFTTTSKTLPRPPLCPK